MHLFDAAILVNECSEGQTKPRGFVGGQPAVGEGEEDADFVGKSGENVARTMDCGGFGYPAWGRKPRLVSCQRKLARSVSVNG